MRLKANTHITLKSERPAAFTAILRPQSGAGQWIVSEAYDVLKDPQKRAAYDRFGHQAFDAHDEVLRPSEGKRRYDDLAVMRFRVGDDLLRFPRQ